MCADFRWIGGGGIVKRGLRNRRRVIRNIRHGNRESRGSNEKKKKDYSKHFAGSDTKLKRVFWAADEFLPFIHNQFIKFTAYTNLLKQERIIIDYCLILGRENY